MNVDMISIGISFERMLHNIEKIILLIVRRNWKIHNY